MCLCAYIHEIYKYTFVCMNVRMLAFLFVYVRVSVCEDLHIRMHVCMYVCMHACMYVYMFVCMDLCMFVSMFV